MPMQVERVADITQSLTGGTLSQTLVAGFSPAAAKDFDGTVCLQLQADASTAVERVAFRIDHGRITPCAAIPGQMDITLYFHNADEALGLLRGSVNPVTAFMEGRFRSDGYLLWVFAVLGMFRGS